MPHVAGAVDTKPWPAFCQWHLSVLTYLFY